MVAVGASPSLSSSSPWNTLLEERITGVLRHALMLDSSAPQEDQPLALRVCCCNILIGMAPRMRLHVLLGMFHKWVDPLQVVYLLPCPCT